MAMTSISRIITKLAEEDPERPIVTNDGQTVKRREFDLRTNRLARAYQKLGVEQNDFVTIALPNSIEFFEACAAIWKLGATPQPVSSRLPRMELETIVELANPSLIIGIEPGLLGARPTLAAGFQADQHLPDSVLPDLVSKNWKAPTSGGSTGRPKLIVSNIAGEFDLEEESTVRMLANRTHLVTGPLYHNGPLLFSMRGLFRGCHIVVMTRFDAEQTLALIEKYRVDWMMMVPTMMHRIWRLGEEIREKYDLSSLRIMLHLAAPCPIWLKEKWIDWLGDRVHELYGGTEETGATWITGEEWLTHRGSVGKLYTEGQIKVVDENGNELPPGETGEIFFLPKEGQGSTYYYIGAEAESIEDGWESIGDIGYLDEDGYLYLGDRKKDMILCGGANIYPAEVEAAIDSHPHVRSSVVVGLPHEDLGQAVHAIVDAPGGIQSEELLEFLADRLIRYKIPRSFEFVDFPLRDEAGKTRRSALAQERIETQQ
ncbi:MAG: AMP-binding protein [SAR324 cluster bacterium]|nr:AMP-binding protein [SAR324 cluster bacterium]